MSEEINKELENISPQLGMIKNIKEKQDAIPVAYFVHLADRVLHQIYENQSFQQRNAAKLGIMDRIKNWGTALWVPKYSIAFSICFIFTVFYFISNNKGVGGQELLRAVNKSEVLEYLFNHSEELDESMLNHLIDMSNSLAIKDEHEQITKYLEENLNSDEIDEI